MMKKIHAGAALAALIALSGPSLAQPPGPPSFDSLDTNHDSVLSKEEVNALFARFAQGGGGGGGGGPNLDQIFASWDKDGNGSVSKEEFDNRPRFGGGGGGPGGPRRGNN